MPDITSVDKNLLVETNFELPDMHLYSIEKEPFRVYGVKKENGMYRRLPEEVAKNVSPSVNTLHTNTSGGRLRFVTDSSYIAIHAKMGEVAKFPHMALAASAGFDLYVDGVYFKTFVPPYDITDTYEGVVDFKERKTREIHINFPLYSDVLNLHIGLQEGALLEKGVPYKNEKPIVFYGSSITQGCSASRPGTCYPAIISRKFDIDFINLGFSGSACGEDAIIDYIKGLDMSVFVCDYDHNSPSPEHLKRTQWKMYSEVRENHPELPIIMMSRPNFILSEDDKKRRDAIEENYNAARASGDKNVYFLDGKALTALCEDSGMSDAVHPNDFGFASMAQALREVILNNKII